MVYDFDEIIDRRGTDSVKVDGAARMWNRDDLMPLWVADMDFRTPPFVMDAIRSRCRHEVLGYSFHPEGWAGSVSAWLNRRHGWKADASWIGFVPGVIPGMAMGVRCLTSIRLWCSLPSILRSLMWCGGTTDSWWSVLLCGMVAFLEWISRP